MFEKYCDALIIGTDLSGLITGAFLARRGLTVHVLDIDPFARSQKEPDPFCVTHLHSKLFRSILGRLNIPEVDIQSIANHESPLQVILPKKRIDLSANPLLFFEELEREFPEHLEELRAFYENLAQTRQHVESQDLYSLILPNSFKQNRLFKKFVKTHGLDERLKTLGPAFTKDKSMRAFIEAQLRLVAPTHTESPFAFQVAQLLNPSEGEVFSIQGGHQFLKQLFIERITHHDGICRKNIQIEKLLYRDGIFEGVSLGEMEGNVLARYIVWNTDIKLVEPFLPPLWRFKKVRKQIKTLKATGYWFTTHFEVPSALLPHPMKDNLLIVKDSEQKLEDTNFLYIQIKNRNKEFALLSVSYLGTPEVLTESSETTFARHQNIQEQLVKLIPFSTGFIRSTFPLATPTQTDDTLFPLTENDFEIFRASALLHPVYELKPRKFADLFPIGFKTAAPNLFMTSPEILSSLGYEGRFMLGLKVTDIIWEDVQKEKKWALKNERRIA